MQRRRNFIMAVAAGWLLGVCSGCSNVPPSTLDPATLPAAIDAVEPQPGEPAAVVRWSGKIVRADRTGSATRVEIETRALSIDGAPGADNPPQGSFVAWITGAHGFVPGQRITVAGRLRGYAAGELAALPLVLADDYYLWDRPSDPVRVPYDYSYGDYHPRVRFGIGLGFGHYFYNDRYSIGINLYPWWFF